MYGRIIEGAFARRKAHGEESTHRGYHRFSRRVTTRAATNHAHRCDPMKVTRQQLLGTLILLLLLALWVWWKYLQLYLFFE